MGEHKQMKPTPQTRARLETEATVAKSSAEDVIVDGDLCQAIIAEVGCNKRDFAAFIGIRPETLSRMLHDPEISLRHPLVKRLVRQIVLVGSTEPDRVRRIIASDEANWHWAAEKLFEGAAPAGWLK